MDFTDEIVLSVTSFRWDARIDNGNFLESVLLQCHSQTSNIKKLYELSRKRCMQGTVSLIMVLRYVAK